MRAGDPDARTHGEEEGEIAGPSSLRIASLGKGLPGSGGYLPTLEAACEEQPFRTALRLTDGLGGAAGILLMSPAPAACTRLFGGHLHVDLSGPWERLLFDLHGESGVPGAGHRYFALTRKPRPMELVFQAVVLDPGARDGLSLSNALRLVREA